MKLNLACGQKPMEGYVNVDIARLSTTDQVCDLLTFPWPWPDASIEAVNCSHFFEHVPNTKRARFMNELYRILKPEAQATLLTPHWASEGAYGDYTHEWPPIGKASYSYFDKPRRMRTGLTHYEATCDFDATFTTIFDETRHPVLLTAVLTKKVGR